MVVGTTTKATIAAGNLVKRSKFWSGFKRGWSENYLADLWVDLAVRHERIVKLPRWKEDVLNKEEERGNDSRMQRGCWGGEGSWWPWRPRPILIMQIAFTRKRNNVPLVCLQYYQGSGHIYRKKPRLSVKSIMPFVSHMMKDLGKSSVWRRQQVQRSTSETIPVCRFINTQRSITFLRYEICISYQTRYRKNKTCMWSRSKHSPYVYSYSYVYCVTWRFDSLFSRRFRSPEGDTVAFALAATLSTSNETIRPRKSLTSSFNRL